MYKPACSKLNFFCHIAQFIRHRTWKRISKPLGTISWNSNKAIIKHFGNGVY